MQQGLVLDKEDYQEMLDPVQQKNFHMIVAKVHFFLTHWARFDCSYESYQAEQLARFWQNHSMG